MFRDLLSSRMIQAGLVFFVLVVGSSLLYSWHVYRTTEAELGPIPQPVGSPLDNTQKTNTAPVDFQTDGVTNTPDETTAAETIDETEPMDLAYAFLPEDFVPVEEKTPEEKAPAEDVPVSPYGFGPYPEVPAGCPVNWKGHERFSAELELLTRVIIKLWNEGKRPLGGFTARGGRVYPNYPNTVYIEYSELPKSDGTIERYISGTMGGANTSEIGHSIIGMSKESIPSHITAIDMDSPEAGIDPYQYLDIR